MVLNSYTIGQNLDYIYPDIILQLDNDSYNVYADKSLPESKYLDITVPLDKEQLISLLLSCTYELIKNSYLN